MQDKVKQLAFGGMPLFCGIDVHKKSWRVNIRNADFELENYSQDPKPEDLLRHLEKNYPGANYQIAYEAGFCGFGIERLFNKWAIPCMVVNPADVPSSDKDRRRKQDRVDARKISRQLSENHMEGIYVPEPWMEHARSLVRERARIVRDQTRCKNRIWHLLMFSGLEAEIGEQKKYWRRAFIEQLRKLPCGDSALRSTLDIALEEYLQIRQSLNNITRAVRALSREPRLLPVQEILQSIDGIGLINAMIIHTEIQDMRRFKLFDHLCSYAGIIPDTGSSGDKEVIKGITHRSNKYLREALVESSWIIIRKDPAMLMKYRSYCSRMNENKAIIKIAKHLLSRIRYLWLNGVKYEKGIVA